MFHSSNLDEFKVKISNLDVDLHKLVLLVLSISWNALVPTSSMLAISVLLFYCLLCMNELFEANFKDIVACS